MDSFGSDRKLSELGDLADLQDLLQCGDDETPDLFNGEHQLTRTRNLSSDFGSGSASAMLDNGWLENFLDDSSSHETPASSVSIQHHFAGSSSSVAADDFGGIDPPEHVTSEHSYSLADGGCVATTTISTTAAAAGVTTTSQNVGSPICFDIKMETADMDLDVGLFGLINPDLTLQMSSDSDASTTSGIDDLQDVAALTSTGRRRRAVGGAVSTATAFVVRRTQQPTAAGASVMRSVFSSSSDEEDELDDVMLSVPVKQEPVDVCGGAAGGEEDDGYATIESVDFFDVSDTLEMPPTPPSSSSCSSDSEAGGLSPRRLSAPSSPVHHHHQHHHVTPYHTRTSAAHVQTFQLQSSAGGSHQQCVWTSSSGQQPLFASPIPSSGILVLSEEEKRTLVAEGYPIPTKLPLTKQEEKNLKKIRRKIKNKISAQESRRKKKEYLEHLEKRVEFVSMENMTLRKKLDALESNNRSLASQLQKLQSLASRVTAEMQAATTCITVS